MKATFRTVLSVVLSYLMVISILPLSVLSTSAADNNLQGEGTQESPYRIYSAEDFAYAMTTYGDTDDIFFSLEPFEESYRLRMNEWKASPNTIKISFDRELYQFLLTVLPHGYTWRLEHDYDYYVMNQSYLIQKNDLLRPNKKGKKRARKMKDGK